jgi:hypothetical protein
MSKNEEKEKDQNGNCKLCNEKLTLDNKSKNEPDKLCKKCYDYALERAASLPVIEYPIASYKL